ncbi:hypothetical protein D6B99_06535 [Arachidicoccus soli]|uniref:Uncharacterized protein n=1 Tax=Arachidicoccus soli TaxID=2341117 RepID=A0A386HN16_9BACT|nr:hypothetical protein D6B99_06535 [Arachidicoccus soli]
MDLVSKKMLFGVNQKRIAVYRGECPEQLGTTIQILVGKGISFALFVLPLIADACHQRELT